jgi:MFS family permease
MTQIAAAQPAARLLSTALVRLYAVDFAAMACFYLLLPVVPMYAADRGIGSAGGGLTTGVLMLVAVGGELAVPELARRIGYRRLLIAGLVLLGGPALLVPTMAGLTGLMAVAVARGIGFAIVVVAVGAMAALMIPKQRRGEGLGVLGVVAMLPAVLMLPAGVWLAQRCGYSAVFGLAAAFALIAAPFVPAATASALPAGAVSALPAPAGSDTEPAEPIEHGSLAGARDSAVLRLALLFAATAVAGGVVVAFLPTAVAPGVAAIGLFIQSAVATLARWLAGRHCDRHGAAGLLVPAVGLTAAGMAMAAFTSDGRAVVTGMVVFGAGFGLAQAATLTAMLQRARRSQYGAVSAAWNAAYDLGWGAGAIGIGAVVATTGHPAAFAVTALVVLTALPLSRRRPGELQHS